MGYPEVSFMEEIAFALDFDRPGYKQSELGRREHTLW